MAQAQFWIYNYNADGEVQDFINTAKYLDGGFSMSGSYAFKLLEKRSIFYCYPNENMGEDFIMCECHMYQSRYNNYEVFLPKHTNNFW